MATNKEIVSGNGGSSGSTAISGSGGVTTGGGGATRVIGSAMELEGLLTVVGAGIGVLAEDPAAGVAVLRDVVCR